MPSMVCRWPLGSLRRGPKAVNQHLHRWNLGLKLLGGVKDHLHPSPRSPVNALRAEADSIAVLVFGVEMGLKKIGESDLLS